MIHQPANKLRDKVERRLAHYVHRAKLPAPTEGPIVSFGFDDCPCSAVDTALPMLEAEGWRATIYVAMGLCNTVNHLGRHISHQDVIDIHAKGHEIGDHTYDHLDAQLTTPTAYLANIKKNQDALAKLGIPASTHFAYPYGTATPGMKRVLKDRFATCRGVVNTQTMDANLLPAQRVFSGLSIETAIEAIDALKGKNQWLNLFSHDVRDHPSDYGCTRQDLSRIIEAVIKTGARVMTVGAAYDTILAEQKASST